MSEIVKSITTFEKILRSYREMYTKEFELLRYHESMLKCNDSNEKFIPAILYSLGLDTYTNLTTFAFRINALVKDFIYIPKSLDIVDEICRCVTDAQTCFNKFENMSRQEKFLKLDVVRRKIEKAHLSTFTATLQKPIQVNRADGIRLLKVAKRAIKRFVETLYNSVLNFAAMYQGCYFKGDSSCEKMIAEKLNENYKSQINSILTAIEGLQTWIGTVLSADIKKLENELNVIDSMENFYKDIVANFLKVNAEMKSVLEKVIN